MKKICVFFITFFWLGHISAMDGEKQLPKSSTSRPQLTWQETLRESAPKQKQPVPHSRRAALAPRDFPGLQNLLKLEAERLLELALSGTALETITPADQAAVTEIETIIREKKYVNTPTASADPTVNKAIEIFVDGLADRSFASRSEELIAQALYAHPGNADDEHVVEVRKVVQGRIAHLSKNPYVREALTVYREREDVKADLLRFAAQGTTSQIQKFIATGGNIDAVRDNDGNTVLALSVIHCKLSTAMLLIKAGSNPNTVNSNGDSPLDLACRSRNEALITILREANAQKGSELCQKEELFETVCTGKREKLKQLLKTFSPNMVDADGNSLVALAAQNRCEDVLYLLVEEYGARVNTPNKSGRTALDLVLDYQLFADYLKNHGALTANQCRIRDLLFSHARKGEETKIQSLLDSKELIQDEFLVQRLVNAKDHYSNTMLALAARNGHLKCAQFLVETCKVELNSLNDEGFTALDQALYNDRFLVAAYLERKGGLSQKIDISEPEGKGRPAGVKPLELSSIVKEPLEEGHAPGSFLSRTQLSLQLSRSAAEERKKNEATLLISAVTGNVGEMEQMIEKGVVDSPRDGEGHSALALAVIHGRVGAARLLVKAGADCNALNNLCQSIYDIAQGGSAEIIDLLAVRGAKSGKDIQLQNALFKYAREGKTVLLKKYLIPDLVQTKDGAGNTLLAVAAANAHLDTVQMLVTDFKAKVNSYNRDKQTVFDVGCKFELVAQYLELIGALSFPHLLQRVEFLKYAGQGDYENVKRLANALATNGLLAKFLRIQDDFGNTPLLLAARSGNLQLVKYLVEDRGADVFQENFKGHTPAQIAEGLGHSEVAGFLDKAGVNREASDTQSRGSAGRTMTLLKKNTSAGVSRDESPSFIKRAVNLVRRDSGSTRGRSSGSGVGAKDTQLEKRPIEAALTPIQQEELLNSYAKDAKDVTGLIEKGIDIHNARDSKGNSLLALATLRSNLALVCSVLGKRVNPNTLNENNLTPLDQATFIAREDIIRELKKYNAITGAEVLARTTALTTGQLAKIPLLLKYADEGRTDLFKDLLATLDPVSAGQGLGNIKDESHNTPLLLAARKGHYELVLFLIKDCLVDPNPVSQERTPLDLSIEGSHERVSTYLKEHKAQRYKDLQLPPSKQNDWTLRGYPQAAETIGSEGKPKHMSPGRLDEGERLRRMTHAAEGSESKAVYIGRGHRPEHIDQSKHRAAPVLRLDEGLQLSSRAPQPQVSPHRMAGNLAKTSDLLENGAVTVGINSSSRSNHRPLQSPSVIYEKNTVHELLASYASLGKASEFIELLKSKNISPEILIDEEDTFLCIAARNGHLSVVKALVQECKAEVNALNKAGEAALDLAAKKEDGIYAYLREKDACSYDEILTKFFGFVSTDNLKIDGLRQFLQTTRISPNATNRQGFTAVILAARNGNIPAVKLLVDEFHASIDPVYISSMGRKVSAMDLAVPVPELISYLQSVTSRKGKINQS